MPRRLGFGDMNYKLQPRKREKQYSVIAATQKPLFSRLQFLVCFFSFHFSCFHDCNCLLIFSFSRYFSLFLLSRLQFSISSLFLFSWLPFLTFFRALPVVRSIDPSHACMHASMHFNQFQCPLPSGSLNMARRNARSDPPPHRRWDAAC